MAAEKIPCADEKYKECNSYKKLGRGKQCKVDGCGRKKTNAVRDSNNTTYVLSRSIGAGKPEKPGEKGGPTRLILVEQDATTTGILTKLVAKELDT